MSDEIGREETNRLLGRLLEDRDRASQDRVALASRLDQGFAFMHSRLDALAALPGQQLAHEKLDTERFEAMGATALRQHAENSVRLALIEVRLGNLETSYASAAGARAAFKYLVGLALTALALVAGYLKWGK